MSVNNAVLTCVSCKDTEIILRGINLWLTATKRSHRHMVVLTWHGLRNETVLSKRITVGHVIKLQPGVPLHVIYISCVFLFLFFSFFCCARELYKPKPFYELMSLQPGKYPFKNTMSTFGHNGLLSKQLHFGPPQGNTINPSPNTTWALFKTQSENNPAFLPKIILKNCRFSFSKSKACFFLKQYIWQCIILYLTQAFLNILDVT